MPFPREFEDYVAAQVLDESLAAYAELDPEGRILSTGGELRLFGPAELVAGTPLAEIAAFTAGLTVAPNEVLVMPRVAIYEDIWADVHVFPVSGGFGLLLRDVSDTARQYAELVQQANEVALVRRDLSTRRPVDVLGLFRALDTLLARRQDGRFIPVGRLPDWGGRFVPLLDAPMRSWDDDVGLAYLASFLEDARPLWDEAKPGRLGSSLWIDQALDGTEFVYEATAVRTEEDALLLVTREDASTFDKQFLIQTGRELALQHRNLDRRSERLEEDRQDLEARVRARTRALETANQRLEDALRRRAELEDERASIIEQAEQSQRMEALGTLAGGIAHDFNNVLAAVLGYSELGVDPKASEASRQRYFEAIIEASLRAQELVRQILVMTRRTEVETSDVNVRAILEEVQRLMRATLSSAIDIRMDILGDPIVEANSTELHQIVMNLCTNAGQAMLDGGVLQLTLAEVSVGPEDAAYHPSLAAGRYARIEVRDSGEGIAPDVLPKIFTPFFTTKAAREGTGIGLSVVQGIVSSAGGFVDVSSDEGLGSCFTVYWPVVDEAAGSLGGDPVASYGGSECVLFVDDEPMQVEIARQMLGRLGYEIVACTSSTEALEKFLHAPDDFDLVITDLAMPELNGEALLRRVLQERPSVPVLVLSGDLDADKDRRLSDLGVRAYLTKPVRWQRIAEVMRSILDAAP
ncbi:MAG: ATP-binding protein [Pseudomonadota bacterium]